MIWFTLALAGNPLPPWVEHERFVGFVDLVDAPMLSGLTSAGHPAHTLGTQVVLVPIDDADVDLDAALLVLQHDSRTKTATLAKGRIELDHEAPLDALQLSFGSTPLADVFELEESHAEAAVLPLENISSARAWVSVEGNRIGRIGPYTTAIVRDIPAGTYSVSFELPNGYVRKAKISTTDDAKAHIRLRMRD